MAKRKKRKRNRQAAKAQAGAAAMARATHGRKTAFKNKRKEQARKACRGIIKADNE